MSKGIDYSKWDNIDCSSSDEEEDTTTAAMSAMSLQKQQQQQQPAAQPAARKTHDPKHVHKLVQKRYNELRQEGQDTRNAMIKAREEFGLDQFDGQDAGKQVASMFGMPM